LPFLFIRVAPLKHVISTGAQRSGETPVFVFAFFFQLQAAIRNLERNDLAAKLFSAKSFFAD
jgi:hypothetical protein